MSSGSSLEAQMSKSTSFFGLKLWILVCIAFGSFILLILGILSIYLTFRRHSRQSTDESSPSNIPNIPKDIRVDHINDHNFSNYPERENIERVNLPIHEKSTRIFNIGKSKSKSTDPDVVSQSSSVGERGFSPHWNETLWKQTSSSNGSHNSASPLAGLPETSHVGWGHWFTLRDLEFSTNRFATENVIGEGGYGVVYRGMLKNGTEVAVKKIFNNLGQAEKEFKTEVEAIGHVRHKNLVRLLGYCIEGVHRMLVYEYVNNGNLEQWLHGAMRQHGTLTWEARIKIILGTAKALAYLHEAVEPKVIHRDIKSSNILVDHEFNPKVSDFGLAKLLDSDESYVTTRVMGTFGYVAPEYANTGMLNEKNDIYSFGVLLLEAVTGRDPVNNGRPANEVNMVEWLKTMVGNRRSEEVVDINLEVKPSMRVLKRVLLVALRCVDHNADQRPKMSQVVRMLEADDYSFHEERKSRRRRTASIELESMEESQDVETRTGDETPTRLTEKSHEPKL